MCTECHEGYLFERQQHKPAPLPENKLLMGPSVDDFPQSLSGTSQSTQFKSRLGDALTNNYTEEEDSTRGNSERLSTSLILLWFVIGVFLTLLWLGALGWLLITALRFLN